MDDIYIEYGSMRLLVIDLEIVLNDHSIVVHEKYILSKYRLYVKGVSIGYM